MLKLSVNSLSKRFGSRRVFKDLNFELTTGQTMAVVGQNGSGKTTLLLTLLGSYLPTKGEIEFSEDNRRLKPEELRLRTSLVGPYVNLYDVLTANENIVFFATMAEVNLTGKELDALLARVGLEGRGEDHVGEFSSGMKQRLKYAVALLKKPSVLMLDEPTANLDSSGKEIIRGIIDEYRKNSLVILATNEREEEDLGDIVCRLAS